MHRDTLIERLKSLRPALEAEGVRHMILFGSRARGDHRPESDIDLLLDVEPSAKFSLLDLVGVEHIVSDAIGMPANAFMSRSLDESFRRSIEAELVAVF